MAVVGTNLVATGGTGSITSQASASYTPSANQLVLCIVESRTAITVDPTQPTLTGNGLTWVVVATIVFDDTSSSRKRITVFRSMGASPTTGAVTADFAAQTQTDVGIVVDQFSGVDTSGTNGSGAVVQSASAKDNTGTATSLTATLAAFGSANNATYGGAGFGSVVNSAGSVGTGFTGLSDLNTPTTNRVMTEWKATNDTTVDINASAVEELGIIGIEIKAAVVAALPPTERRYMQAVNRAGSY